MESGEKALCGSGLSLSDQAVLGRGPREMLNDRHGAARASCFLLMGRLHLFEAGGFTADDTGSAGEAMGKGPFTGTVDAAVPRVGSSLARERTGGEDISMRRRGVVPAFGYGGWVPCGGRVVRVRASVRWMPPSATPCEKSTCWVWIMSAKKSGTMGV